MDKHSSQTKDCLLSTGGISQDLGCGAHPALDSHREGAMISTRRHNSSWHLLSAGWHADLFLRTPHISSPRDDSPGEQQAVTTPDSYTD